MKVSFFRVNRQFVSKACDGLFKDHRHLESLFCYLSGGRKVHTRVQKLLGGHIENLELYLSSMNDTLEYAEKLEKIKEDCVIEFGGSKVHKYIHILRMAGDHFDGDGSALFRLQTDDGPKSAAPHILAIKVGKNYHFELWVERERVLENLELEQSISAFLHLAFCFHLKYPKSAETVADFLQRVVADSGDDSGTRTSKNKDTAASKLLRYHIQLGKVLGEKKASFESIEEDP